jgi:hypothetical protein
MRAVLWAGGTDTTRADRETGVEQPGDGRDQIVVVSGDGHREWFYQNNDAWCSGSTTAFGAVGARFESLGVSAESGQSRVLTARG